MAQRETLLKQTAKPGEAPPEQMAGPREPQPNGRAAATILAAGISCLAFGLLTVLAEMFKFLSDALRLYPPAGQVTGATQSVCGQKGANPTTAAVAALDLVELGVGEDGHTASLFPDQDAVQDRSRLVVPVAQAGLEAFVALGAREPFAPQRQGIGGLGDGCLQDLHQIFSRLTRKALVSGV